MPVVPCPHCTAYPSISLATGFSQPPLLPGNQAKLAWLGDGTHHAGCSPCINPSSDAVPAAEPGGGMERGSLCPCFFWASSDNASGSCKRESEAGLALLLFCLISAVQSLNSSQVPLFLFSLWSVGLPLQAGIDYLH